MDGFNFPRTAVGRFAYSDEICPRGTSAAGKPQASVRCSSLNGRPEFLDLRALQCDQSLSDIQQNLTTPADLEILASSTQILTSRPEALTAKNVTTAAQIANTLLLSPNATESVRVAAVATVSQLLSAGAPDDEEENQSTLNLTHTLDQLSLNLSLSSNTSQSQVVQPNLVVQSVQVSAAGTGGVQFTSLSGLSGSFAADRIQLNTNTSTPVVENGVVDAMVYIQFPPEVVNSRQTPSNASLGFLLYQNDRFFRSRLYRRQRATVRVLSAFVRDQERSVIPQHVEMRFTPKTEEGVSLYGFACVFWDFNVNDWSTSGCWKGNATNGVLQCFCNHTTNFAALWSFREDYKYVEALGVVSIIGLSVSLLGLVVTILYHLREKNRKSQVSLLCVCVSLLTFIITFLSGVQNSSRPSDTQLDDQNNAILLSDERVEPDVGACTAVTALLHYFLLATFMWNGVYGTELVMLVRSMRRSLPPYWTTGSLAVGWGVPVVFMAVSLGATYRVEEPLRYRQEEFCWLAALDKNKQFHFGRPMFWGFLIPASLILVYNLVLMVLVSMTTCKSEPQIKSTRSMSPSTKVLVSLSVAIMLGLSWTLGYLVLITSGHMHLVFSIVFCISTSTQGLQIFILFTARKKSFRKQVSRPVQRIQYELQFTKYSLTRVASRITESISESYRDMWCPENPDQP
ncbi:adhesion G-protein coupled receptor G7-like [Halichoeres trimaculatus]|uniref:adhesion G-protein coupled receptor G7-like n=1 Tax=Halichoeres trimaculatus TaxID=147232 RepID=UPI003D9F9CB5